MLRRDWKNSHSMDLFFETGSVRNAEVVLARFPNVPTTKMKLPTANACEDKSPSAKTSLTRISFTGSLQAECRRYAVASSITALPSAERTPPSTVLTGNGEIPTKKAL